MYALYCTEKCTRAISSTTERTNGKMSQSHWYNEDDATWQFLWWLVLFSFSESHTTTEISLIPNKHFYHMINVTEQFRGNLKTKSQSLLSSTKDPNSSGLIYLFTWFVLCISKGPIVCCVHTTYIQLMLSCWFIFLFFIWLFENKCESECLSVCLSQLTSDSGQAFVLAPYMFTRMTAAYSFIAHYHPFKTGDYAPLIFWNVNVISKLFPCSSLILCFVHNWLLSGQPYLFEQLLGCISSHGLYSCLVEWNTAPNVLEQ